MVSQSLPFDQEVWYNVIREREGPVTRSSPGPWPRGSDTLATISIALQPAGANPTGGLCRIASAPGQVPVSLARSSGRVSGPFGLFSVGKSAQHLNRRSL